MSTDRTLEINSQNLEDTIEIGRKIGKNLKGGEVIELLGDVGSGKTTFVRGLAQGAGSPSAVASPSFTISRVYRSHHFDIYHFDFYRLDDPGLMKQDISEVAGQQQSVTIVEWSKDVNEVLPEDRAKITITSNELDERTIKVECSEANSYLISEP